jgi:hypothetical protein
MAGIAWAGYGDERALIEDLQVRYLFAFDFGDAEGYAGTFAPDGVLDEMVKVDGEWLFSRRRIYNEAIPEWASQYLNPVTNPSAPPKYRAPSAPRAN